MYYSYMISHSSFSAPNRPARPTEDQIRRFVHAFYAEVRADPALGPIFADRIGDAWDAHLERMVDFWSSILLATGRYAGNPRAKHAEVPAIRSEHFDRWLTLFEAVLLRELEEPIARDIVARAHRMRLVLDTPRPAALTND
jgi:hemoglobin